MSNDKQWCFCLRHKTVEQGPGCPNEDRMGPYGIAGRGGWRLGAGPQAQRGVGQRPEWNDD